MQSASNLGALAENTDVLAGDFKINVFVTANSRRKTEFISTPVLAKYSIFAFSNKLNTVVGLYIVSRFCF